MIGIGIRQSSPPGRRRGGNVAPTVTLTGLTSNPTYGATAQNGVELTAVPAGFPQGATFSYLWRTWENATSLATSATFTPDADAIDLDNVYCVVTPSVGDPVNSSAYVVRYAPPVAAGGIADQSWPEDDGITPLDLAADFTGSDITYALAPSSAALPAGLSLLAAGSITGTPTTPASSANIVVRGTNSGGSTDTAFGATVSAATVSISGLTTNPTYGETAEIGSHASIGASISSGTITSYRWGNAVSGTEYGTGSSPSDFSAGDGGTLHLEIVADGDTYNATATIRHAPPVAGSLGPVNETQGGGTPSVNLSAGFTGSDLTYSENAAWASISGSTLTINDEVRTDTLTITATNSGGAATVDLGVTISAAATSAITGLTNNAIYGTTAQVGVELTGTVSGTASGHAWTLDGAFISGATAATYTPVSGDDLGVLRYTPTVDGNLVLSTGYTVRHAPPVAGTLAPITETHGTGTPTVNVAAGFTGSSLIYTETVAWASISGSTLTINDEVRTATLTITATNSGGAATVDLSVTIEATGDETAPVLSSISWDDGTDAASFTVSEGGTLIVATHDSAETLTPDGSGGWTGTVIETDSVAIAGEGPTNYTVSYTDASQNADRVSYYVRDAAGNDSAVQTETFTSNLIPTAVVLSGFVDNLDQDAPSVQFETTDAGTVRWDFHSSATPPAAGAGDHQTGTFAVSAGVVSETIDLSASVGDTGYVHFRQADSNILTSQVITVPAADVAPTISSTTPADNATGVAINVDPTVTFSENVVFGTGLITLYNVTDSTAVETFDVATAVGTSPGQVNISGAALTIYPTSDLSNSIEYAIQIAATAIDDSAGNSFAGVTDTTTISFTTVAAAGATLRTTLPAANAWTDYIDCSGTTSTTVTVVNSGSLETPFARMANQNLGANGSFEFRATVSATNFRYVYMRALNFDVTTDALFDTNTGTLTSGTGTMTDLGGGSWRIVMPFAGTTDAIGNLDIGMSDLAGQLRISSANGDEVLTVTNAEIWAV